jgi:hypothetical protein
MLETRPVDLHEQEFIGDYCVSTVALTIEHHGGMWYETYIFPADGKKITGWLEEWGTRYRTREKAVEGHAKVCALVRNGVALDDLYVALASNQDKACQESDPAKRPT